MAHAVIASDLPKFFRTRDFGLVATRTSDSAEFDVILSRRYFAAGGDVETETQYHEVIAETSDGIVHDDVLTIDAVSYTVVHVAGNLGVDVITLRPT